MKEKIKTLLICSILFLLPIVSSAIEPDIKQLMKTCDTKFKLINKDTSKCQKIYFDNLDSNDMSEYKVEIYLKNDTVILISIPYYYGGDIAGSNNFYYENGKLLMINDGNGCSTDDEIYFTDYYYYLYDLKLVALKIKTSSTRFTKTKSKSTKPKFEVYFAKDERFEEHSNLVPSMIEEANKYLELLKK